MEQKINLLINAYEILSDILPFTLTRSNSVKSDGNWKLMKAAQWNTQSTPSNAFSIVSGSQISPMNETIGFASEWSGIKTKLN